MQTAQNVVESFLREKWEMDQADGERSIVLHQKFFTEEYVNRLPGWYAQVGPESVVSVDASDTCASVITAKVLVGRQQRFRYLLKLSGTDWQIDGIEWECSVCHGTGRKGKGAADCPICKGAGWKPYGPR